MHEQFLTFEFERKRENHLSSAYSHDQNCKNQVIRFVHCWPLYVLRVSRSVPELDHVMHDLLSSAAHFQINTDK